MKVNNDSEHSEIKELLEGLDRLPEGADRLSLLNSLLLDHRHDRHEDIVFELGLLGNPSAVPAIAKAVTISFPSLVQWGNLKEFRRKCAFALARIGTTESRSVLEQMSRSLEQDIREFGKEGMSKWPLEQ